MDTTEQANTTPGNAGVLSPATKAHLLLKGLTEIPFAAETARLVCLPDIYKPDIESKDNALWKRLVHFEYRYWSVDKALEMLPITNVLELASGFSFRGLEMAREKKVHYIDIDLPEIIEYKKKLLAQISAGLVKPTGKLETIALNVLDERQVSDVIGHFPKGPVVIVNEGLLMYLDQSAKEKLCSIIYKILKQRGGYWITADIYRKTVLERLEESKEDHYRQFTEQQKVEQHMFDSFAAAETFFNAAGFTVERESDIELSRLSSLKYLLGSSSIPQLLQLNPEDKIQLTWTLRVS